VLNQSADYALRAVMFMAQGDGKRSCSATVIARAIGVPRNYLGKILHALAHAGILTSVRGPQGGFRLAQEARLLTLAGVVEPFQRLPERRICLLGDRACNGSTPCAAHHRWQQVADQVTSFFTTTTIGAMLNVGAVRPDQTVVKARPDVYVPVP
jgi:Rrf2 family protein